MFVDYRNKRLGSVRKGRKGTARCKEPETGVEPETGAEPAGSAPASASKLSLQKEEGT